MRASNILCKHKWKIAGMVGTLAYLGNYWFRAVSAPEIHYNPTSIFMDEIVRNTPILTKKYWPTIWAYNKHLSTAITQLRSHPRLSYEREVVDLPDGGVLALDWRTSASFNDATPTVLFLPGLSGTSSSEYIQHMIVAVEEIGWRSVVMNYRGTAGMELKSEVAYSAGFTADVKYICSFIRSRLPNTTIVGIGFSLGSNVLVKYCSEESDNCGLNSIISISNPYDLIEASKQIESGAVYTRVLAAGAVQTFKQHKHKLKDWRCDFDIKAIESSKSIKHYDEHFTRRIHGYKSAEHYYMSSGCRQFIPGLSIPSILISARDDPIVPEKALPFYEVKHNKNTLLIVTRRGGHVSFCEGLFPFYGHSWMDRVVQDLLVSLQRKLEEK